ncbi:MAG: outer membrane beta-barrel domain-containing protein [Myxococcota bacterium]
MTGTRTLSTLLACMLLVPPAAWAQEGVEAGDEDVTVTGLSGPPPKTLAERIPSVTRPFFSKGGRIELVGGVGTMFNDPFYDHIVPSLAVAYHVFESLWVGASADYHVARGSPPSITGGGKPKSPKYNRPQYAARLEAAWAPFYGKLSLLAETVLHFDTYISVGGGLIGGTRSGAALGGTVAVGQHFFLSEAVAIRLEVRDQIVNMSRNPGTTKQTIQNFLSVSIGVCFYVPPSLEHEGW